MANDVTMAFGKPLFTGLQLIPLLEDWNIPSLVPAKIVPPERPNAVIVEFVRPLFTDDQLVPLSVER